MDEIKEKVKDFLLREYLPGEAPESLDDTTPLITGGILDSISTLKLVTFLEETFGVEFQAHEMSADTLDNLASIAAAVRAKLEGKS
jgi:acyl carrier protein